MERRQSKLYNLDAILQSNNSARKSKIICTIGPSVGSVEKMVELIDAGMCVARLNFSHGDHKSHGETLKRLREAFALRKDKPVSVLLDTKGPEIRTGFFKDDQKSITLKAGQDLEITTDYSFKGDSSKIACSYEKLPNSVKVGGQILIADGQLVCVVKEILSNGVIVKVENDAKIGERKNMNLPGCKVDLPTVTEKDEEDIVDFGLENNVDIIALSFTRTGDDIQTVRDLLGPRGKNIQIVAKIENQEGLENFDEILEEADGIMVARGDLGMEIPASKVFVAQKFMINKCNTVGKPVIVATQMMESMINNPRPTRAESSDVANAILDGADCVMLSGETANGAFPIDCVKTMASICVQAESCFDSAAHFWNIQMKNMREGIQLEVVESICMSSVQISMSINSPLIVVFTQSGRTARTVAKYRPKANVIAVSFEDSTIKALNLARGITTLRVPSFQGIEKLIDYAIQSAKEKNICYPGQRVVCITGQSQQNFNDIITVKAVPKE